MTRLTNESVGKYYLNGNGEEILVVQEVKSCCRMLHYLGSSFGSLSLYPYDAHGRRMNHQFKIELDNSLHLIIGE